MTQTLRMRIRHLLVKYIFHEHIFSDLFCLVQFPCRFEIKPIEAPFAIIFFQTCVCFGMFYCRLFIISRFRVDLDPGSENLEEKRFR
jgi:hypothetical protein